MDGMYRYNTTARDGLPVYYNQLNEARVKALDPDVTIETSNHILPYTAAFESFNDSLVGFFIGIAFSFIPASYTAFVVLERETNAKHLQIISGVCMYVCVLVYLFVLYIYIYTLCVYVSININIYDNSLISR